MSDAGDAESKTTYLVEFKDGKKKRIMVPSSWKVTFGPLAPGTRAHNGEGALALRFYETKEKQRAVFTNVKCFRDMGISVSERVVHVRNERAHRQTADGLKDFTVQAEYAEWRNEDDDTPTEFSKNMKLPKLDDDDDDGDIEF